MPHDATESVPFEQQYLMWCGSVTYILLLLVSPKIGFTKKHFRKSTSCSLNQGYFSLKPSGTLPDVGLLASQAFCEPKAFLDLIGYLNWLQDQLGFRMGFNPCDNSVGTSLYGQWGTTQVYLFVNRSQCIAVLLHPKKTSPEPISLSSRGKSRRGILEIGSRPLLIPRAFGQVALNNKVCRSRGHSWDCGSRNPGFWAVQQTTCFFSFSGAIFNQAFKAI